MKYITFHSELHFLLTFLYLYMCMYTLCVCLPPGPRVCIGRVTRLSEVVQNVLGMFCVRLECGLFKG